MIKANKLCAALLAVIAVLIVSGCQANERYGELTGAVENTNAYKNYEVSFYMSITSETFDITNMFAQGQIAIDKSDKLKMSGAMTQYAFEETAAVNLYYEDGKYYTDIPDQEVKAYTEISEDVLLEQFIFADAALFDAKQVKSLKVTEESGFTTYDFVVKPESDEFGRLLGENLYLFSGAGNPDLDKTVFGDAVCSYVVRNDEKPVLHSVSITFPIAVYNKMPYVPGVKYKEDDFRVDVTATLRMNYKAFGEDASVKAPDDLDDYMHESDVTIEHE